MAWGVLGNKVTIFRVVGLVAVFGGPVQKDLAPIDFGLSRFSSGNISIQDDLISASTKKALWKSNHLCKIENRQ
jgi:hypothetical protein